MAIKAYGKYTGYLTDPWSGQKVPYDERYPQQKERLMKKHRQAEATVGPLTEAAAYYQPGGGFGKGVEAGLERERTQAMSSGMQALVSSGLAGTTMAGGLGKKFAEEVGMPTRARIEETRAERLSAIKMLRAQLAQASTEAERQRISQELMARMSSGTSLAIAGIQRGGGVESPTMQMTSQPQTKTDSWSPGGLPSATGAGAATYGVGGGMDAGTPTQEFWGASEQWRSEQPDWVTGTGGTPSGQEIPGQHTPSEMDEYLKTYVPKSGDFSTFSY